MGSASYAAAPVAHTDDAELVAAVRAGDDNAFDELYRRYEHRIGTFVRRRVRDSGRAEDVTQEVFLSAVRRLRATDGPVAFKPWVYEIARNASIDFHRRTSRSEEISIEEALSPTDRVRLVSPGSPDATLAAKERIEHLCGAFQELPPKHTELLVLRELEGLSYREIEQRTGMSRAAVESALFRARRRLEAEFSEIDTGRRCGVIRGLTLREAEGSASARERVRVARHLRRCDQCRRFATEAGVPPGDRVRSRVAALLPLPAILRRRFSSAPAEHATSWMPVAAQTPDGVGAMLAKSAAVVVTLALAGTGGAVVGTGGGHASKQPARHGKAAPAAAPSRTPAAPGAAGPRGTTPRSSARRAPRSSAAGPRESVPSSSRPAGNGREHGARPAPARSPITVPALPGTPAAPEVKTDVPAPRLPALPDAPAPSAPSGPSVKLPPVPPAVAGATRSLPGEQLTP